MALVIWQILIKLRRWVRSVPESTIIVFYDYRVDIFSVGMIIIYDCRAFIRQVTQLCHSQATKQKNSFSRAGRVYSHAPPYSEFVLWFRHVNEVNEAYNEKLVVQRQDVVVQW